MLFNRAMLFTLIVTTLVAITSITSSNVSAGILDLTVTDRETGKPIPFRMHLKNPAGRPKTASKMPFWKDHFVSPGNVQIKQPRGAYTFEIERGPEYLNRMGHFVFNNFAEDEKTIDLKRFINMAEQGWYSGDLHIHRRIDHLPLLMRADDLYIAPTITWSNKKTQWENISPPDEQVVKVDDSRFMYLLAGEDSRAGGKLLYFNLPKPLDLKNAEAEYPSSVAILNEAKQHPNVWVDIANPASWDLPLWLASGKCDSIAIANEMLERDSIKNSGTGLKPKDNSRFPGTMGTGFWSQYIYYHILNCGIQLSPSAGSGSGVSPNPIGYNRVYVQVDSTMTYENWWDGLKAGRCFVTNGPLIRVQSNGQYPGSSFTASEGQELVFKTELNMSTRDKIRYLEIIKNGEIAHSISLDEFKNQRGRLPEITFNESGWFLLRVVAENTKTFRFASTAPFYVKMDGKPRISKSSVQFFIDWLKERRAQITLKDAKQQQEVMQSFDQAEKFWHEKLSAANAD